ncbi:MAG: flippase [Candidatus Brocadiales bacterium]|nr:flippase [Candidatus Bathyanammoxibius sp.]
MKKILHKLGGRFHQRFQGEDVGAVLARGASGAFVVRVLGAGSALGVQILLARLLGATSYGDYIYAITWMNFLALFSRLGLDSACLRFVAAYHGLEKWSLLRGLLQRSQQIALVSSVLTALAAGGVVWLIGDSLRPELRAVFWVAWLLVPARVLLEIYFSSLWALKRVVLAQVLREVFRPLLLACGVYLIFEVLGQAGSAPKVMAVYLVVTVVAPILAGWSLHRTLPPPYHTARAQYKTKEWCRVAIPLLLVAGFHLALYQTDILMIGAFLGTTDAGIYAAATRVASLILFGVIAVNAIAAPMISELYAQGRHNDLQRMITLAARGILIYSLPVTLFIVVLGKWMLGFFGQAFTGGYTALVVLAVGQLVVALAGSVGFLMIMTDHHHEATWIVGGSALLNVILNATLIPVMGIPGAAVATTVANSMNSLVLSVYVKKKLNISATAIRI